MPKKGVQFSPPIITEKEYINLLQLLASTNLTMGKLASEFKHSIVNNALVSIFSLNESVQSTRIEGTQVTFTEMLESSHKKPSWEQQEVLNYQEALNEGLDRINNGYPISTRLIKDLHKILMKNNARGTNQNGGEFRKIQNFIGPDNKIENATYIPVAANEINQYMENLEYYVNSNKHRSFEKENVNGILLDENSDIILKIAIAHAQFESIHPFLDGNGRLGRILIALLAVQADLVDSPVFLVSEELERERIRYYNLLSGVRGNNPDWFSWLYFFIECSKRMAERLLQKLSSAEDLAKSGIPNLKLQSEQKVWIYTFSNPITTVSQVAKALNISTSTARSALNSLSSKRMIYSSQDKRNKQYANYDLVRILTN